MIKIIPLLICSFLFVFGCKKDIPVSSIKLNRVIVEKFPIRDRRGHFYDDDIFPDLYFILSDINGNSIYSSENYASDVSGDRPVYFDIFDKSIFLNPGEKFIIDLYDYDPGGPDDKIYSFVGIFKDPGSDRPEFITLENSEIKIAFQVEYK